MIIKRYRFSIDELHFPANGKNYVCQTDNTCSTFDVSKNVPPIIGDTETAYLFMEKQENSEFTVRTKLNRRLEYDGVTQIIVNPVGVFTDRIIRSELQEQAKQESWQN